MEKCEGCGKEVPYTHDVFDVEGMIHHVCAVCKARIEKEVAEAEYWKEKKRQLERDC